MERMIRYAILLGCAVFLLTLSSYVIPEFARLLFSAIGLLALVGLLAIALVAGFTKWRRHSSFWLLPSVVCLAFLFCSFYVASPMGRYISDRRFEKQLGEYSSVVFSFRDGKASCAGSCKGNAQVIEATSRPAHISDIRGTHCDDSGVIVLFRVDNDVPLLHEGYMFKDYEDGSNCSKMFGSRDFGWPRLRYVRHITGHWYRFSDQPGL